MKSVQATLLLAAGAVVLLACAASAASTSQQQAARDQLAMAAGQQGQRAEPSDLLKSAGGRVTKRDYHYDNSWWAIGLVLVPLLLLLCFPLFSTPYYGGHGHGHGGHHGWGWGRSNKEVEAIQERVLKSVEQFATNLFSGKN